VTAFPKEETTPSAAAKMNKATHASKPRSIDAESNANVNNTNRDFGVGTDIREAKDNSNAQTDFTEFAGKIGVRNLNQKDKNVAVGENASKVGTDMSGGTRTGSKIAVESNTDKDFAENVSIAVGTDSEFTSGTDGRMDLGRLRQNLPRTLSSKFVIQVYI